MKKVFFIISFLCLTFFALESIAQVKIIDIKLNGESNATVSGAVSVPVEITVIMESPDILKAFAYKFTNSTWTCINTPDRAGPGIFTEKFFIQAPTKIGTTNVDFQTYDNDDCKETGLVESFLPAGLVAGAGNILPFDYQGTLFLNLILIAILLALFVVLYFIKNKKQSYG